MAADNEELTRITQQVALELEIFGKVSQQTADALRDAQVGVKGFSEAVRKMPGQVGGAATDLAKAMYEGEKGAAAFNKSIDGMASAMDSAITILTALIPGGPLIKATVVGLGLLAKALVKTTAEVEKAANIQGDALYTTFQKLSKAGVVASGGTTQLGKDLQKLGLGFQDAEQMVQLMTENSADLLQLGKTAFQGADAFTNIVGASKPLREEFRALGLSQEAQNEAIMGYVKLQTRLGNAGTLAKQGFDETAKAALKYVQEQDELTRITGISRKEQQKALDDAMRNARFAATLDDLNAQNKKEESKALTTSMELFGRLGPQAQKGFQDIVAGLPNTKEARQLLLSSQGEVLQLVQKAKSGQLNNEKDLAKAYDQVEGRIRETTGSLRTLTSAVGDTGVFLDYAEARRAEQLQKEGKSVEESLRLAKEEREKQQKLEDERVRNQVKTDIAQQNTMLASQELVDKAITPTTATMLKLAEAAEAAAKALLNVAGGGKTRAEEKRTQTVEQAKVADTKALTDLQGAMEKRKALESSKTATEQEKQAARDEEARATREAKLTELEKSEAALREKNLRRELRKAQNIARQQGKPIPQTAEEAGLVAPAAPAAKGAPQVNVGSGPPVVNPEDYIKFGGGTGDKEHFAKLDPGIQQAFLAMARDYNQLSGGDKLQVNSAFRSPEEQAATNSGSNPKAAPGMSLHQQGRAIDVNSNQAEFLLSKGLLSQYGFKSGARDFNDPPHIYARAGFEGTITGPVSGYRPDITMHGTEQIKIEPVDKADQKASSISTATANIGKEFKSAFETFTQQFDPTINETMLVVMQDLVREVKTTNDINKKILAANR